MPEVLGGEYEVLGQNGLVAQADTWGEQAGQVVAVPAKKAVISQIAVRQLSWVPDVMASSMQVLPECKEGEKQKGGQFLFFRLFLFCFPGSQSNCVGLVIGWHG